MKVYIVGYKGNMGRRYRAILDYLGHEVGGEDAVAPDAATMLGFSRAAADAFIVATPTETHARVILELRNEGKPILCEKPITKSMSTLESLLGELKRSGTRLDMVSQYDYLLDQSTEGDTVYDYFRHGGDGLGWDCINILKHARGHVELREQSPVWQCWINGKKLDIRDMDRAYVEMLKHWLRDPTRTDLDAIWRAHKLSHDWEAKHCRAS